jgi:hypothetical protein
MSWIGRVMDALGEKPMQPPEQKFQEQGTAWCSGKLCDTWRVYDVLPGTKSFGIPDFAFCCTCGDQIDVDLPEPEEAA